MALAVSMKNFVDDLKASRRSRHEFVKGNREIAKNMMAENRKFLGNIRAQNKINAEQTRAFLKSAKEERMQSFKQMMDGIHESIAKIHQAKDAIAQEARGMIKEFREDNQMARKYWASLATDEPIEEPSAPPKPAKGAKKTEVEADKAEVKKEVKKREETANRVGTK